MKATEETVRGKGGRGTRFMRSRSRMTADPPSRPCTVRGAELAGFSPARQTSCASKARKHPLEVFGESH